MQFSLHRPRRGKFMLLLFGCHISVKIFELIQIADCVLVLVRLQGYPDGVAYAALQLADIQSPFRKFLTDILMISWISGHYHIVSGTHAS